MSTSPQQFEHSAQTEAAHLTQPSALSTYSLLLFMYSSNIEANCSLSSGS